MSFWSGLSGAWNWLRSGLARADAAIRAIIIDRPATALVVAIIATAVAIFGYRERSGFMHWLQRAEPGQIIVNSPTVYTRQRLVNDRLEQTRWLQDQLKLADRPVAGKDVPEFRIVDHVSAQSITKRVKFAAQAGQASKNTNSDAQTSEEKNNSDASSGVKELLAVTPTTGALFRAKNAFREEVRGEMTQTQLDDRHDIRGNTIYRLAFDATVVAGTRKDSVAGVKVTLGHYPHGEGRPVSSGTPESHRKWADALEKVYEEDYKELYFDWIRQAQRQAFTSLAQITRMILKGQFDLTTRLAIDRFLLGRICELALGRPESGAKLREECDPHLEGVEAANRRVAIELWNKYAKERSEIQNSVSTERLLDQLGAAGIELEGSKLEDVYKRAQLFCKASNQATVSLLDLKLQTVEQAQQLAQRGAALPVVGCPYFDSPTERLRAGIILHELLSSRPPERQTQIQVDTLWEHLRKSRRSRCLVSAPSDSFVDKSCGNPELDAASQCFAADFLRAKFNGFDRDDNPEEWERLGSYFNLRVVGREANSCQLSVSGIAAVGPAEKLKSALNRNTDVFSYSVNPKNLAENISTARQTRDVFEILAGQGFEAGSTAANGVVSKLFDRSDRLQGILEHPVVVGFGSGQYGPEVLNSLGKQTAVARNTSFGWIIAPRNRGVTSLEQIDGQYALTSVISVPSWWRSVEVEIETCWIARTDLPALSSAEGREICKPDSSTRKTARTVVRFPGAITELSRKLGFEVVQEPYLTIRDEDPEPRLEIGQRGDLLLVGGRLWRSTDVTLGTQRATSITVLPNMDGIIATFECVLPQSGQDAILRDIEGSSRRMTRTPVQVWTSEGVTQSSLTAVLLWPLAQAPSRRGASTPAAGENSEAASSSESKDKKAAAPENRFCHQNSVGGIYN